MKDIIKLIKKKMFKLKFFFKENEGIILKKEVFSISKEWLNLIDRQYASGRHLYFCGFDRTNMPDNIPSISGILNQEASVFFWLAIENLIKLLILQNDNELINITENSLSKRKIKPQSNGFVIEREKRIGKIRNSYFIRNLRKKGFKSFAEALESNTKKKAYEKKQFKFSQIRRKIHTLLNKKAMEIDRKHNYKTLFRKLKKVYPDLVGRIKKYDTENYLKILYQNFHTRYLLYDRSSINTGEFLRVVDKTFFLLRSFVRNEIGFSLMEEIEMIKRRSLAGGLQAWLLKDAVLKENHYFKIREKPYQILSNSTSYLKK